MSELSICRRLLSGWVSGERGRERGLQQSARGKDLRSREGRGRRSRRETGPRSKGATGLQERESGVLMTRKKTERDQLGRYSPNNHTILARTFCPACHDSRCRWLGMLAPRLRRLKSLRCPNLLSTGMETFKVNILVTNCLQGENLPFAPEGLLQPATPQ